MQSHRVRRILPARGLPLALTPRHLTARPSPRHLAGRSGSDHLWPRPVHTKTGSDPGFITTEKTATMRLSQLRRPLPLPRLSCLLGLTVLAGLSACGPASSDNAASLESRATVAGPEAVPLASNPVPRASENGTGSASNPHTVSVPFSELVLPDLMAKELEHPDRAVRLGALDRWGQSAPVGSVDPLIQALEDQDKRVQERALELIVQDWVREQAAERIAGSEQGTADSE